jgi:hypothetical protein
LTPFHRKKSDWGSDHAKLNSLSMVDEKKLYIAFADDRILANLQVNPNAVYMIM